MKVLPAAALALALFTGPAQAAPAHSWGPLTPRQTHTLRHDYIGPRAYTRDCMIRDDRHIVKCRTIGLVLRANRPGPIPGM